VNTNHSHETYILVEEKKDEKKAEKGNGREGVRSLPRRNRVIPARCSKQALTERKAKRQGVKKGA